MTAAKRTMPTAADGEHCTSWRQRLPAAASGTVTAAEDGAAGEGAGDIAVLLDSAVDWPGFVRAARGLLHAGVEPTRVQWRVWADAPDDGPLAGPQTVPTPADADLFADSLAPRAWRRAADWPDSPAIGLPTDWVAQARCAACHADPARWHLLYRAAWRVRDDPLLANDPLDADMRRLAAMARQVRRAAHKMRAFVRFRPVATDDGPSPLHLAWFDPPHHVQEQVAPFFVRRFTAMRWTILTPRISMGWADGQLRFSPGAPREACPPPDAGEALWLAYYRSIFNPARLKVAAMKREMPVRYWSMLPEAQTIAPLVAAARERTGRMLAPMSAHPPADVPTPNPAHADGAASAMGLGAAAASGVDGRADIGLVGRGGDAEVAEIRQRRRAQATEALSARMRQGR